VPGTTRLALPLLASVTIAWLAFSRPVASGQSAPPPAKPLPATISLGTGISLSPGASWVSSPIPTSGYSRLSVHGWCDQNPSSGLLFSVWGRSSSSAPFAQLSLGYRAADKTYYDVRFTCESSHDANVGPSWSSYFSLEELHCPEVVVVFYTDPVTTVSSLGANAYLEP
jgi:hypothetical protein